MPAGTVEVLLIGASGIKDTELFGKADPYAVLKCGKQTLRSNVANNQGSKPVWNQRFSFYIDDSVNELQVRILNHNIFTEDDEIGSTTIPLARVFAECKLPTTSYNVVRPSGKVRGEVKLSLTFNPKKKPGASASPSPTNSVSGSVSGSGSSHGPYSSRTHPGPYRQPEPESKHQHDPLTGPHGYYKNSSSSTADSLAPPYGSGVGAWNSESTRPPFASDSDGSSRLGHGGTMSSSSHSYPSAGYPHVGGPVNPERLSPYPGTESTASSYPGEKNSSTNGSSHGPVYPHSSSYPPTAPSDYGTGPYRPLPYEHMPHSPGPSEHGGIPRLPSSQYPPGSSHVPSYSASLSQKPRHSTVSQYHLDEVTAGISGLGISGHASDISSPDGYRPQNVHPPNRPPLGPYPGERLHAYTVYSSAPANLNERPAAEYPRLGGYPPAGYPPEASSHGKPPASEYPSGYPPAGYPPSDSSSHGMYGSTPHGAYPPPYSLHHGPPPSSRYYPPQAGNPGQHDSYPPVPFYNANPTHYVPAGYPK